MAKRSDRRGDSRESSRARVPRAARAGLRASSTADGVQPWVRRAYLALGAALALAVFVAFAPALRAGFTNWDDDVNVVENPFLNPHGGPGVAHLWTHPYRNLFIPLVYTSYVGDFALGGGRPWAFHLVNVALHAVAALLVLLILSRLVPGARSGWAGIAAAGAGALLFALHPVQVEPVAWVTGRKDVLSGVLALAAMLAYLAGVQSDAAAAARRAALQATGLALFLLALLAKPSAVSVPLALAAVEVGILATPYRRIAVRLAPWFALAALWFVVTAASQQVQPELRAMVPAWKRPVVAGDALLFYASKLAAPVNLAAIYGRFPWDASAANPLPWLAVMGAMGGAAWLLIRRSPWGAAAGIALAGVLPVLGFAPFRYQVLSTVADRYLYLALPGAALAAALGLSRLLARRPALLKPAVAAVLALAALLGALSWRQCGVWRDSVSLWSHSLAIAPGVAESRNNYGIALVMAGREPEGFAQFEQAVAMKAGFEDALNNYAIGLTTRRRYTEALAAVDEALREKPDFRRAHISRGNALLESGKADEAVAAYERALELDPGDNDGRFNLAHALAALGRQDAAVAELNHILSVNPRFWQAHQFLGVLCDQRGMKQQAIAHFEQLLALQPDNAEALKSLARLRGGGVNPPLRRQASPARTQ